MKIRFSREAQQQVLKEKQYMAAHSRWASIDFTAKMQRAVQLIGTYPDVGTATGAVEHVRKLVLSPYYLHYVVRKSALSSSLSGTAGSCTSISSPIGIRATEHGLYRRWFFVEKFAADVPLQCIKDTQPAGGWS